ncbi:hypothetical protein F66182_5452 [Fusarium sp. NRRL 66182]|nr:hypothetical protein F66182_5452 [Fusarium sp. NRRL 66182]
MAGPKSINDIIRQHPRERLYVQPLEWTQLHLDLLKAAFQEDMLQHLSGPPENGKPAGRWSRAAERLANSDLKNAAIKTLVSEDGGPLRFQRPFGYFCFSPRHEFRLHGAIFSQRSSGTLAPVFAFMMRGMIGIQREGVFVLPKPRRPNPPAELLREMRLKKLEPSDPWRDPYILAVLVGMAQSQAEDKQTPRFPYVDEKNHDYMYFYSAGISVAFLSKFEYPATLAKPKDAISSELCIQMKKIPFQPYSTLRPRLHAEVRRFCDDVESAKK